MIVIRVSIVIVMSLSVFYCWPLHVLEELQRLLWMIAMLATTDQGGAGDCVGHHSLHLHRILGSQR